MKFSIPDLGIKSSEGRIPDYVAKKNKDLRDGEIWGVITLAYIPPQGREKGVIELIKFKPFKQYEVDFAYFKNARKHFSIEEWIDLLIRSMEYNPDYKDSNKGFDTITKKTIIYYKVVWTSPSIVDITKSLT